MHTETTSNSGTSGSNSEMQQCIRNCVECYQACTLSVQKCLSMGGQHATKDHVAMLLGCAKICNTSADLMMLGTHTHSATCAACAEICEMCASACSQMEGMEECAQSCRTCAESCREMSAH